MVLHGDDHLAGVRLVDGRTLALDALFIGVPTRLASSLAAQLGCAVDDTPLGPIIRVDGFGQTTAPGVFAAGDAARPMKSLAGAVADGYTVGVVVHRSMLALPACVASAVLVRRRRASRAAPRREEGGQGRRGGAARVIRRGWRREGGGRGRAAGLPSAALRPAA